MHLLDLENYPILSQLELEEALLRADDRNWCLINQGTSPAIVMGISGKPEQLVHQDKVLHHQIPLIRRFSGGGTVVVDQDTFFVTFICNRSLVPISIQPEAIMKWSESFYKNIFTHLEFKLRENDYVIGHRKFGGNAQYLRKDRWLHHTSFLWHYTPELMNCLKIPSKMPKYRESRDHNDFLCTLKEFHPSKELLRQKLIDQLKKIFSITPVSLSEVEEIYSRPYRKTTTLLSGPWFAEPSKTN